MYSKCLGVNWMAVFKKKKRFRRQFMAETNWTWASENTIKHIWKNNTQWIHKGLAHFTGHAEMYMNVLWSPDDKITLSRQKVTESFLRRVFKRTDSWKWIELPIDFVLKQGVMGIWVNMNSGRSKVVKHEQWETVFLINLTNSSDILSRSFS